jgi:hypothetical protein
MVHFFDQVPYKSFGGRRHFYPPFLAGSLWIALRHILRACDKFQGVFSHKKSPAPLGTGDLKTRWIA